MTTLSSVTNVTPIMPRVMSAPSKVPDTHGRMVNANAENAPEIDNKPPSQPRNRSQAGPARHRLQRLFEQMGQLPEAQRAWPVKAMLEGALRLAEKHQAAKPDEGGPLPGDRTALADALLNPLGNTTLGEMLEKATDYLAFKTLHEGVASTVDEGNVPAPERLLDKVQDAAFNRAKIDLFRQQLQKRMLNDLEEKKADARGEANGLRQHLRERLDSEAQGSESREQTLSRMMNTFNDPPPMKSDKEIFNDILKLITHMQDAFMQPFIGAAEKMRVYYDTLSTLRDIIAKNVKAEDDKNVKITRSEIFKAIEEMINQFSGEAGVLHQADSEEEARSMREKFGSGVVTQDPKSGKWVVKIDITQLNDMNKTARDTLTDDKTSLTAYNNFLSAVDAFLTREQNKTSKITNQLEYYNKLINNVQDTVTQFYKQMCELAINFLRI
ncbi:hypothetical protein LU196_03005 [Pantoea sp. Mb-10]|uniref:hypothetical protein n=1 Tax=unclassified Pantoea TaxID=2630326 RepID=UPI001E3FE35F|nr:MULTISPECIES: hypothetical protein [unclassified Pantoea]MCE0489027.1 hypothetical protein [Pantoea sp. Mb-10]MCE0503617.1 hypothetical protein [Pantoea sp. Pb-8]